MHRFWKHHHYHSYLSSSSLLSVLQTLPPLLSPGPPCRHLSPCPPCLANALLVPPQCECPFLKRALLTYTVVSSTIAPGALSLVRWSYHISNLVIHSKLVLLLHGLSFQYLAGSCTFHLHIYPQCTHPSLSPPSRHYFYPLKFHSIFMLYLCKAFLNSYPTSKSLPHLWTEIALVFDFLDAHWRLSCICSFTLSLIQNLSFCPKIQKKSFPFFFFWVGMFNFARLLRTRMASFIRNYHQVRLWFFDLADVWFLKYLRMKIYAPLTLLQFCFQGSLS